MVRERYAPHGIEWQYNKVTQEDFQQLQPADFADLRILA
jgi:hypothetical protein